MKKVILLLASALMLWNCVESGLDPEVPNLGPSQMARDYVDEYGINHGKGVEIDGVVWAPVNCGYHKTDYKYGKLYQWGRKYGQGYSGNFNDGYVKGEYSDVTTPVISEGPVSLEFGQSVSNENVFIYCGTTGDWLSPQDDTLWNSGTEDSPVKTEYDPCPEGWRVPTYAELSELRQTSVRKTTKDSDQSGYWFSGAASYEEDVPQLFLPASGFRNIYYGDASHRGGSGLYWSSSQYYGSQYYHRSYGLSFSSAGAGFYSKDRAFGASVRCVQE